MKCCLYNYVEYFSFLDKAYKVYLNKLNLDEDIKI